LIALEPQGALRPPRTATAVPTRSRIAGLLTGLTLAGVWVLYNVQPPAPAGTDIDPSWRAGLTMAAREHLQFGHDIVFTYGPLGYVLTAIADPALAATSVAMTVVMALVATAGVWMALRGRSAPVPRLALIAAMVLVGTLLSFDYVVLVGIVALLSRASRFPRFAAVTGTAIGIAGLFGALSKYTLGLDVFAAAGAVWLVDIIRGPARRRRATALAVGFASAIALLGLAATFHFSPSAIVDYVRSAAEISAGYSQAMAVSGDGREIALAIVVAVLVLAIGVMAWREGKPTIAPMAATVLFLAWKHGFVRQDAHVILYFGTAAAVAAVVGLTVRRPLAVTLGLGTTVVAAAAFLFADARAFGALPPLFSTVRLVSNAHYVTTPVETQRRLAAAARAQLAPDQLPPDLLARIRGSTVDALPSETAIIAANSLRWAPLPVFQLYSAYTPALDHLNSNALDAHGADYILYEYTAIDNRLRFGDAPATIEDLVCRYRPIARMARNIGPRTYVLLRRIAGAGCYAEPAGSLRDVAIGKPIDVPAARSPAEFVIASFALRPTLLASLRTALWHGAAAYLDTTYADGSVRRWRLVAATLGDGVIMSAAPRDPAEAAAFFAGDALPQVRSVTLVAHEGAYVLDGVTFTRIRRYAPALAP
jgi:hypothetical protein